MQHTSTTRPNAATTRTNATTSLVNRRPNAQHTTQNATVSLANPQQNVQHTTSNTTALVNRILGWVATDRVRLTGPWLDHIYASFQQWTVCPIVRAEIGKRFLCSNRKCGQEMHTDQQQYKMQCGHFVCEACMQLPDAPRVPRQSGNKKRQQPNQKSAAIVCQKCKARSFLHAGIIASAPGELRAHFDSCKFIACLFCEQHLAPTQFGAHFSSKCSGAFLCHICALIVPHEDETSHMQQHLDDILGIPRLRGLLVKAISPACGTLPAGASLASHCAHPTTRETDLNTLPLHGQGASDSLADTRLASSHSSSDDDNPTSADPMETDSPIGGDGGDAISAAKRRPLGTKRVRGSATDSLVLVIKRSADGTLLARNAPKPEKTVPSASRESPENPELSSFGARSLPTNDSHAALEEAPQLSPTDIQANNAPLAPLPVLSSSLSAGKTNIILPLTETIVTPQNQPQQHHEANETQESVPVVSPVVENLAFDSATSSCSDALDDVAVTIPPPPPHPSCSLLASVDLQDVRSCDFGQVVLASPVVVPTLGAIALIDRFAPLPVPVPFFAPETQPTESTENRAWGQGGNHTMSLEELEGGEEEQEEDIVCGTFGSLACGLVEDIHEVPFPPVQDDLLNVPPAPSSTAAAVASAAAAAAADTSLLSNEDILAAVMHSWFGTDVGSQSTVADDSCWDLFGTSLGHEQAFKRSVSNFQTSSVQLSESGDGNDFGPERSARLIFVPPPTWPFLAVDRQQSGARTVGKKRPLSECFLGDNPRVRLVSVINRDIRPFDGDGTSDDGDSMFSQMELDDLVNECDTPMPAEFMEELSRSFVTQPSNQHPLRCAAPFDPDCLSFLPVSVGASASLVGGLVLHDVCPENPHKKFRTTLSYTIA